MGGGGLFSGFWFQISGFGLRGVCLVLLAGGCLVWVESEGLLVVCFLDRLLISLLRGLGFAGGDTLFFSEKFLIDNLKRTI